MRRSDPSRAADLAKIHIARKDLGLDDETYRAMLARVGGVRSARDLDIHGRAAVLAELRRCGFRPRPPRAAATRRQAGYPQARKIRALWLRLHAAGIVRDAREQALARYVRRQSGIERLDWLTERQASAVIEALKGWAARTGVALEP